MCFGRMYERSLQNTIDDFDTVSDLIEISVSGMPGETKVETKIVPCVVFRQSGSF